MPDDVRLFLRKLLIFSLPVWLYVAVVAAVDPYDALGTGLVGDEIKLQTAYKLNYALWKLARYRRDPRPLILLGDSRMMELPADSVTARAGMPCANLAYGGGSLREAIDTFWYATGRTRLREVCFGVGTTVFNDSERKDRVSEARACLRNPLLYLININVVRSTAMILTALVTGQEYHIGVPTMTPEQFWQHQLGRTARAAYTAYRYPRKYLDELSVVADYCRRNDIRLTFVVFPRHRDLRRLAAEMGLAEQEKRLREDLAALGEVFDLDYDNAITRDRSRFRDPFHFKESVVTIVLDSVWGDDRRWVRVVGDGRPGGGTNHG